MKKTIDGIIGCCGTEMTLVNGRDPQPVRALLQVARSKSQEYVQRAFGPLGEVPKGTYVYIGPAEPAAVAGDELWWGQRIFSVRCAEPVMYGGETMYIWGLCVEKGGEGQWGA
jgi:hypothetical protein